MEVFVTAAESVFTFLGVEVEGVDRDAVEPCQPVLGAAPEWLNAVDVLCPLANSLAP